MATPGNKVSISKKKRKFKNKSNLKKYHFNHKVRNKLVMYIYNNKDLDSMTPQQIAILNSNHGYRLDELVA